MLGIPLHPLVVHFPIVLCSLLPIVVLVVLWTIKGGASPRRAWTVPLILVGALTVSAFIATRTGENEEDRVEKVVARGAIHEHEEAAERLLLLSGALFVVALGGLLSGTAGVVARTVTAVGAVGLLAAGVQVGHSGGSLVYREGAASAYTTPSSAATPLGAAGATGTTQ